MAQHVWTGATSGAWNTTTNWSPNGTPGAGDTIILDGRATQALTGNPTDSPQLALIRQHTSCAFDFGTPAAPIAVWADVIEVGVAPADGTRSTPGEFHINAGTNAGGKFYAFDSDRQGTNSQEPVTIKTGTPASGAHAVYVSGATVGLATAAAADTAVIATWHVSAGTLNVSSNTTWATSGIVSGSGKAYVFNGTAGTLTIYGGELYTNGVALIATLSGYGGTAWVGHRVDGGDDVTTFNAYGTAWHFEADGESFQADATNIRGGSFAVAHPTQLDLGTVTIDFNDKMNISIS